MKNFLVIDAFGILYRYYYIFLKNPLTNETGENTSAIFGFLRTYFSLLEDYSSDYTCIALDKSRYTFRNKIYPEYKANREHMPEDLKSQIPLLMEVLEALRLPYLSLDDYEADDIIGTIATENEKKNIKTTIYSPDKDILQLVNENTKVVCQTREYSMIEYDRETVKQKRGVYPEHIIDLLALMGDASDNIPGVKGVGEKTAIKLLDDYKDLDGVYANTQAIKGKLREKIESAKEMAYLSKELVTIKKDIDLNLNYEDFEKKEIDKEKTFSLLRRLGLKQIEQKVEQYCDFTSKEIQIKEEFDKLKTIEKSGAKYYLIENDTELTNLLDDISEKKEACVDFETTGLDVFSSRIIGIAFSLRENEALYLDLSGRTDFDYDKTLKKVFKTIASKNIRIIGQNLKYEYKMAKASGFDFPAFYFDTMVASYLWHPSQRLHNFDYMAQEYLGYKTIKYGDITDDASKTLLEVPLCDVVNYASEDADITLKLKNFLSEKLEKNNLKKLFEEIEMPLVRVLAKMEFKGVKPDLEHLSALSKEYEKKITALEKKIFKESGEEFNISSPKQVGEVLFSVMNLPTGKKTKTGYSTGEEVLSFLAEKHDIAKYILEHRKFSKLKSTYIDVYPTLVNAKTERIHTSFNQTITATGRLSSSEPNLQNIPIKSEEGRDIRRCVIAEEGHSLISADYSQVELRLLAHFSEDDALVASFKNNEDIHTKTATRIFSVSEKHVTKTMRYQAKIVNFSIIYGKSAFGLAKELNISRTEAASFISGYFATYPKVETFRKKVIDAAKESEEVRTICARARKIDDINSRSATRRQEGERIAVNTLIQGSAADLIKIAMVKLDNILEKKHPKASIIIQVHDELVVEAPNDEVEEITKIVKDTMENALKLKVPLLVDINSGDNWGDIH